MIRENGLNGYFSHFRFFLSLASVSRCIVDAISHRRTDCMRPWPLHFLAQSAIATATTSSRPLPLPPAASSVRVIPSFLLAIATRCTTVPSSPLVRGRRHGLCLARSGKRVVVPADHILRCVGHCDRPAAAAAARARCEAGKFSGCGGVSSLALLAKNNEKQQPWLSFLPRDA